MTATEDPGDARARVLLHWQAFCAKALPGTVRRIAAWKGVPPSSLRDLVDDVAQELAADGLEHAGTIASLTPDERHARWMRHVERSIYRERFAARRRRTADVARCVSPGLVAEWHTVGGAPPGLAVLGNGRCSIARTASETGLPRRRLRLQLDELARRCGDDPEQRAFWRRRLAEALVGLAVDLLRLDGRVYLTSRPRRPPDLPARQRRLWRLTSRFPRHAATRRERELALRWAESQRFDRGAPAAMLAAATTLAPDHAAAWAWRFEACVADGDLAGAARALRVARGLPDLPAAAAALARVRLREARGDRAGAARCLVRAQRRRPRDPVLAAVHRAAVGASS